MVIVLIHWRIKPGKGHNRAFVNHWKTVNAVGNRRGLISEFLSNSLPIAKYPYITWHLDPESTGDFKSYVTIGIWKDSRAFKRQIAKYFNDDKEMLPFEKYRRRRVIFRPTQWRIGRAKLPKKDSQGVE